MTLNKSKLKTTFIAYNFFNKKHDIHIVYNNIHTKIIKNSLFFYNIL